MSRSNIDIEGMAYRDIRYVFLELAQEGCFNLPKLWLLRCVRKRSTNSVRVYVQVVCSASVTEKAQQTQAPRFDSNLDPEHRTTVINHCLC